VYQPKVDRSDLIAQLIDSVTHDFVDEGESSLIAAFSSVSANLNSEQLDKLELLIEQQRQSLLKGDKK
jgi:predicted transcriptional regulator